MGVCVGVVVGVGVVICGGGFGVMIVLVGSVVLFDISCGGVSICCNCLVVRLCSLLVVWVMKFLVVFFVVRFSVWCLLNLCWFFCSCVNIWLWFFVVIRMLWLMNMCVCRCILVMLVFWFGIGCRLW